ncbi:MAG: ribosomal protein S18-alanine N-acetyltransferase [Candidatus Firestonebacteria bacterium]
MQVIFSPMKFEDLDEICAIELDSFPTPWGRQSFLNDINSPDRAYCFVAKAEINEKLKIVGYACFWIISKEINIINFAVAPLYRRKKIGESILKELLLEAIKCGAVLATLEVRISNIPAQKLYEKFGFVPIAIRKKFYGDTGEDAMVMWLNPLKVEIKNDNSTANKS